jgi:undecaprenyl-diphosphatase
MLWYKAVISADRELFLILNGLNNPFWDNVMVMVSNMIDWLPLYAIVLFFIFRNFRHKGFIILISLVFLIAISSGLSDLLKHSFHRLRPFNDPRLDGLVHTLYKGVTFGFVSSHASNTFAAFTFTSLIFRNRLYYFSILFWCLLICYSRIYLGVHFPLDILGGAMFGFLNGWIAYYVMIRTESLYYAQNLPLISGTRLKSHQALIVSFVLGFTILLFMGISFIKIHICR